jgi:phospholipase/lecithinase/hemolysin
MMLLFLAQDLYKLGARKMLVVSVPPLGCVPSMLYKWNGRCASTLNDAIRSYNTALLDAITSLQVGNLSDAHLLYANAYDLALKILDNPQAFGTT